MIEHTTLAERISVLETQVTNINKTLEDINSKLDELIDLKSKGLGAFWLVGLLVGSGIMGFITNLFTTKHGVN